MSYEPKYLRPAHLLIIKLHNEGVSNIDIGLQMDYTPQQVSNILTSNAAKAMLEALRENAIDTMSEVQSQAQLHAPLMFEELVKDALTAPEPKIRLRAKEVVLGIAGHSTRNITIQRGKQDVDDLNAKSDDELRAMLRGKKEKETGVGPDGRLLQ